MIYRWSMVFVCRFPCWRASMLWVHTPMK